MSGTILSRKPARGRSGTVRATSVTAALLGAVLLGAAAPRPAAAALPPLHAAAVQFAAQQLRATVAAFPPAARLYPGRCAHVKGGRAGLVGLAAGPVRCRRRPQYPT